MSLLPPLAVSQVSTPEGQLNGFKQPLKRPIEWTPLGIKILHSLTKYRRLLAFWLTTLRKSAPLSMRTTR